MKRRKPRHTTQRDLTGRGIAWTNLSDSVKTQYWICSAQYTSTAVAYPEETREQRAVKYEYYTSFFVPCAENAGVEFVGEPQQRTHGLLVSMIRTPPKRTGFPTSQGKRGRQNRAVFSWKVAKS